MIQRELFLTHHWKPYPAFPQDFPLSGQVQKLSPQGILLRTSTSDVFWPWPESCVLGPLRSSPPGPQAGNELRLEPFAILQKGDWIACKEAQLWLLAPRKVQGLPSLQDWPRHRLAQWNLFLQKVREYFVSRGLIEVTTPSLVICPGTEPFLEPFVTEFKMGRTLLRLSLPTSPEISLKKLLSAGSGPIFEMKTCFRNGEITDHHEPEFTMLEWYRPLASLLEIQQDLQGLIFYLLPESKLKTAGDIQVTSWPELFKRYLGETFTPSWGVHDFRRLADQNSINYSKDDSEADLFHRLCLEGVEPHWNTENPVLVKDFPASLAAYARLTSEGFADRFELYWKGLEICNAFHEVNDPAVQRQRMGQDLRRRQSLEKSPIALDEDFLLALESGFPPTGGIALGLERLYMALNGFQTLSECKYFSLTRWTRPDGGFP